MGDNGYISLHRKIFENKLWKDKPFSRAQAWIDLLLLAQYSDNSFFIRTIEIKVKRGQLAYSVKTLAKRWGWSRSKVDRFLKYLENEHQIEHQKNNLTTLISIIKYEEFQSNRAPERTPNEHQTNTKRTHNNKDNKDNKDNKYNIYRSKIENLYKMHYPRKIGKTPGKKTLLKQIKSENDLADLEKAISNYSLSVKDTDKKYIKHFSTFANEWRDWIDFKSDNFGTQKKAKLVKDWKFPILAQNEGCSEY